jgi:hypothetical protein
MEGCAGVIGVLFCLDKVRRATQPFGVTRSVADPCFYHAGSRPYCPKFCTWCTVLLPDQKKNQVKPSGARLATPRRLGDAPAEHAGKIQALMAPISCTTPLSFMATKQIPPACNTRPFMPLFPARRVGGVGGRDASHKSVVVHKRNRALRDVTSNRDILIERAKGGSASLGSSPLGRRD